jgi:hypothetical protein
VHVVAEQRIAKIAVSMNYQIGLWIGSGVSARRGTAG